MSPSWGSKSYDLALEPYQLGLLTGGNQLRTVIRHYLLSGFRDVSQMCVLVQLWCQLSNEFLSTKTLVTTLPPSWKSFEAI